MTDALFDPKLKIEFSQSASLLVRAALSEDRNGDHKFLDNLYQMFVLGGKVQANFGTAFREVESGLKESGDMMAIAVLQRRLTECDFLQQGQTGLIVGYVFDHRDRFWRSHS